MILEKLGIIVGKYKLDYEHPIPNYLFSPNKVLEILYTIRDNDVRV